MDKAGITPALSQGVLMEKLLYFVGGIIVGSISTLAALGFSEEELGITPYFFLNAAAKLLGFE